MVAEGYAAVTTRRVASMVGLTAALVHYYFPTTEDLLVAAYRRASERLDERVNRALQSDRPVHTLWNLLTDPGHMALGAEFMALANHRKVIRMEIAQSDERRRRFVAGTFAEILRDAGIDEKSCPPVCAATLIEGMGRSLVVENVMGIGCGHSETKIFIERILNQIEKARKSNRTRGQAQSSRARMTASRPNLARTG
jgi:AcrR family transcriptional regulator